MARYHRCLELGADKKVIAYPLSIGCFLQKDYEAAATWFENCLPCDDEMAIVVISGIRSAVIAVVGHRCC